MRIPESVGLGPIRNESTVWIIEILKLVLFVSFFSSAKYELDHRKYVHALYTHFTNHLMRQLEHSQCNMVEH